MEPVAGERSGGGHGIIQATLHDVQPAGNHFTHVARPGRQRVAGRATPETRRCGLLAQAASVATRPRNGPLRSLVGGGGPGRNTAEVLADGGVQTTLVVVALAVAGH
jgi:hypothetical protein